MTLINDRRIWKSNTKANSRGKMKTHGDEIYFGIDK
jgi:hypothetical protein